MEEVVCDLHKHSQSNQLKSGLGGRKNISETKKSRPSPQINDFKL